MITADAKHEPRGFVLVLDHDKGRSVYDLVGGGWIPRDSQSTLAMSDFLGDLEEPPNRLTLSIEGDEATLIAAALRIKQLADELGAEVNVDRGAVTSQ